MSYSSIIRIGWYDGYIFGNAEIFNPWSVINYFSNDCLAEAYWVETGSNEIIGEVLTEVDQDLYDLLTSMLFLLSVQ